MDEFLGGVEVRAFRGGVLSPGMVDSVIASDGPSLASLLLGVTLAGTLSCTLGGLNNLLA